MKNILINTIFLGFFFTNYSFCQTKVKDLKIFSDFQFAGNFKIFNGNNFLSDAHEPSYIGFQVEINMFEFKNFTTGAIYENNVSDVKKTEIAGNFNYISLNHYAGFIGYKHKLKNSKLTFYPKILIGDIKTKQKASNYYANNNGNYWGLNGQVNYNFARKFAVFGALGYNFYTFKVQTTPEYANYFNKSSAINLTLGIKF